jgi:hypothetical protein
MEVRRKGRKDGRREKGKEEKGGKRKGREGMVLALQNLMCARLLVSAEKTKSTCAFVNPAIKWSRPERNGERFNGRVKL